MESVFSGRFFFFLGLGAAVFLALTLYGNGQAVLEAFRGFSWPWLPLILLLAFLNYVTRFARWELYRSRAGLIIPRRASLTVFMSGLVMTVTPGKMGELLKSVLLQRRYAIPVSRSGPIVLAERITDLLAVYLLALLAGFSLAVGTVVFWAGLALLLAAVLPFTSPRLFQPLLGLLRKVPGLRRAEGFLQEAFQVLHDLLGVKILLAATGIGLLAWFFECLAFDLVLRGLAVSVSITRATFIYAFATLAGAVSLLPGGIGAAEASMTGLLVWNQVPRAEASAATMIIRICTVWFAVAVGAWYLRKFQRGRD